MVATAVTGSVWAREHLASTLGVLLLITLIAFESMGFATALPTMVADLHGGALYAWPFIVFLAASVLATVLGGQWCDRRGPRLPLLAGPVVFGAGLVVSGTAPDMLVLLGGRLVQGIGAGTATVALLVLIATAYPERLRPKVFSVTAAAWVLPAVLGPAVAGLLTQLASWRWVFLALVPLVGAGLAMLVPAVRALPVQLRNPLRRKGTVLSAVGAAVGVSGVSWAAQHPSVAALGYGVPSLVVLALAMLRLLPRGTLHARPGLPVVVLCRALLAGALAAVDAFVPLTLSAVHGYTPVQVGLPLTAMSLGWSVASMWQGRHPDTPRHRLLVAGFLLLTVGVLGMLVVTWSWSPGWPAVPAWAVAGLGMGLGMPSINILLLRFSAPEQRGANSSALQLADWVGTALLIGIGGVLLTTIGSAERPGTPVAVLTVAMACVALTGAVLARRARHPA